MGVRAGIDSPEEFGVYRWCDDELGPDHVLSYRGFWLHQERSPAVLFSNGKRDNAQGRDGDLAWDMATNSPARYQESAGVWS